MGNCSSCGKKVMTIRFHGGNAFCTDCHKKRFGIKTLPYTYVGGKKVYHGYTD